MHPDLNLIRERYKLACDDRPDMWCLTAEMLEAKTALRSAYETGTIRAVKKADRAVTRFERSVLEVQRRQSVYELFERWLEL